jgi:hypothetical protein
MILSESTFKCNRSYWGVLPGEIVHAKNLTIAAKYLYVILSSMAHKNGFCWPENETLASEMQLSKRRVVELLGMLRDSGFIKIVFRQEGKKERRYIYCGMFPDRVDSAPEGCEESQGGGAEDSMPLCEKSHPPMREIRFPIEVEKQIEKQSENTPKAPQGAAEGEKPKQSRKPKAVPTWQPEKFEGFWSAYPRDEDRAKAVEQWDRLPQDKDLMAQYGGSEEQLLHDMSVGLRRHLESRQWQEDVGIPYAFRWLRDRRWTEKAKGGKTAQAAPSGERRVVEQEEVPTW